MIKRLGPVDKRQQIVYERRTSGLCDGRRSEIVPRPNDTIFGVNDGEGREQQRDSE